MRKYSQGRMSLLMAGLLLPLAAFSQGNSAGAPGQAQVEVLRSSHHDSGFVLRDAAPKAMDPNFRKEAKDKRRVPYVDSPDHVEDRIVQSSHNNGPRAATTSAVGGSSAAGVNTGMGFDGVGVGMPGYSVQYAPPDTTGAVGDTQYVQWVNVSFAVFDKATGARTYGPVPGNTLFSGFGGACETSNDGDPVVMYDKLANRWVMMQFAVPSGGPYYQCVAVSKTSDATGAYDRYAFQYSGFNDYPKAAVWPDGYYVSYNMFSGNSFAGAKVCAFDRAAMIAGASTATQQCVQLSTSYGGLLPSDLDGKNLPAAGTPNFFVNLGSSKLNLWKYKVNWTTPSSTTFTGPTAIPVSSFAAACGGGTCIPQGGTSNQLDSLADRAMYRLAYRVLTDGTETMVVNHAVKASGNSPKNTVNGVRWYEIRNPSTTPVVAQQSTFSPDSTHRWMGSIAMDKQGNIALGYSASGASMKPAIRYATRLAGDVAGTLSNETTIIQGGGSQFGSTRLTRWGDYSHMSVDPVDDCTFWFTTEYLKADGVFNWSTRVAAFRINSCQ